MSKLGSDRSYANVPPLGQWADEFMASRPPDFVIGDNYLRRWWVIPRNKEQNIYLHEILHSDDDRAMHDHPWENRTYVIRGGYLEHTPHGVYERRAGETIVRPATALHRLEVLPGVPAITLFFTGPVVREWGFACPQGWRRWQDFVGVNKGEIGRGCGEM